MAKARPAGRAAGIRSPYQKLTNAQPLGSLKRLMTTATTLHSIEQARNFRPTTRRHLWYWVQRFTGVRIPVRGVCAGHSALFDLFARQVLERPSLALWHG